MSALGYGCRFGEHWCRSTRRHCGYIGDLTSYCRALWSYRLDYWRGGFTIHGLADEFSWNTRHHKGCLGLDRADIYSGYELDL